MTPAATLPAPAATNPESSRFERAVLDLLHPDGIARRVRWLDGANAPVKGERLEWLPDDRGYDGVVLEPGISEVRTSDWLARALLQIDRLLTADGIAWVIVPWASLRRLRQRLATGGFRVTATYLHLPHGPSTDYLVAYDAAAIRLLSVSVPMSPLRERIIQTGLRWPATSTWLPFAANRLALVVQRSGARCPLRWVTMMGADEPAARAPLIRVKERSGSQSATLWICEEGHSECRAIVKRALSDAAGHRLLAEFETLETIAASASAAGALVPRPTPLSSPFIAAAYEWLDAVPSDAAIAARPSRVREVVHQIAEWLARWNSSTRHPQQIDAAWVRRELIEPACAVRPLLNHPEPYFQWLTDACARLTGRTLDMVASHGDLTMSNVLLTKSGSLAIIDWESARTTGLPLSDLYYAAADALAAAGRYKDRAWALKETFASESEYGGRFVAALAAAVDPSCAVDSATTEVLLNATALHHAANERMKGREGLQPFAALVGSLEARVRDRA